jgi:hypothetical protein
MTPVHVRELRRLEHLRGLLPSARVEQPPKLLLFGRAGFPRNSPRKPPPARTSS